MASDLMLGHSGVVIAGPNERDCSNSAGTFMSPCSGDINGIGTYARFNSISGMVVKLNTSNDEEYLFIADRFNNKIRRI
jgi:hypothetical protein